MKQLPQIQKLIAMITEALPSRVLPKEDASCNSPRPTRIPAKETLNTASDLIFDLPDLTEI